MIVTLYVSIINNMKLSIIAHPNSKRPRIEKDMFDQTHVYVNTPPLGGKANKAIVKLLANRFNTKERNVVLIKGMKSKNKTFDIV